MKNLEIDLELKLESIDIPEHIKDECEQMAWLTVELAKSAQFLKGDSSKVSYGQNQSDSATVVA